MQKVRQFAYQQIRKLGMNDIIGPVSYDVSEENEFAVKPYSKKTARIIDEVSGEVSWMYSDRNVRGSFSVKDYENCPKDLIVKQRNI